MNTPQREALIRSPVAPGLPRFVGTLGEIILNWDESLI